MRSWLLGEGKVIDSVLHIEDVAKRFQLVELERLLELRPSQVFRRVTAVERISLSVTRGQVYGFLGPNGAGKTTTIKMAMDLIRPSAGSIRLFGHVPRDPRAKHRVGYLPEHPYFYDYLKPQEILDYFGRLFGIERAERRRRIDRLLERVGLTEARNRALRKFSKGMLQRLGIASALINQPELLVLDEPFSGLDPMGRKEMRDIILEEKQRGTTIFFSSHILGDVQHMCDRVAIVSLGRVVREGRIDDLLTGDVRQTELIVAGISAEARNQLTTEGLTLTDLGRASRVVCAADQATSVIARLISGGATIESVQPHRDSLEDLFLRETRR